MQLEMMSSSKYERLLICKLYWKQSLQQWLAHEVLSLTVTVTGINLVSASVRSTKSFNNVDMLAVSKTDRTISSVGKRNREKGNGLHQYPGINFPSETAQDRFGIARWSRNEPFRFFGCQKYLIRRNNVKRRETNLHSSSRI